MLDVSRTELDGDVFVFIFLWVGLFYLMGLHALNVMLKSEVPHCG